MPRRTSGKSSAKRPMRDGPVCFRVRLTHPVEVSITFEIMEDTVTMDYYWSKCG